MTTTDVRPPTRHPEGRFGYATSILVNAVLLFLLNIAPGWQVLPFLAPRMSEVMTPVNLALLVGLLANVAYLAHAADWFRHLGDVAVLGVGLVAGIRIWNVFPFDLPPGFDWELVVRVLLMLGIVGTAIALVVTALQFFVNLPKQRIG